MVKDIKNKLYDIFNKYIVKKTTVKTAKIAPEYPKEVKERLEKIVKYRLATDMARSFLNEMQTISNIDKEDYEGLLTMTAYFYYIPVDKIDDLIKDIIKLVGQNE